MDWEDRRTEDIEVKRLEIKDPGAQK